MNGAILKALGALLALLPALLAAAPQGEAAKAADARATIRWFMRWDNDRVDTVAKPVMAAFQKANPAITVEFENIGKGTDYYTKLNTLAAAADMPDVTYLAPHYVAIFASKGAILALDDQMKAAGIDPKVFYPKVLAFYQLGGKTYGLPVDAAVVATFYNKKMFDSAGVAYPQKGWTWDNLAQLGKKFVKDVDKDGQSDTYAVHLRPDYWPIYLYAQTGHTSFDDYFKPTRYLLTQGDSIEALKGYHDMWLTHKIAPGPTEVQQIQDYFFAGKAAMMIVGSWNMPKYIQSIKDFTWDLAVLPLGRTGVEYNRGDGSAFCLSAHSKSRGAAFKFMQYLAGPGAEGVNILLDKQQMLPAIRTMAESDRFLNPDPKLTNGLKLNKAAYFFGNTNQFSMYDPINAAYEKINSVQVAELGEAELGKVSDAVAVQRAAEQINEILKTTR